MNPQWQELLKNKNAPQNVQRWYTFILLQEAVQKTLQALPDDAKAALVPVDKPSGQQKTRAKEGKFVELPGAEMGKVVVRFPPEASG